MYSSKLVLSFFALVAFFSISQSMYASQKCPTTEMCKNQGKQEVCTQNIDGQFMKHYNPCMKDWYVCQYNQPSRLVDCPRPATNNCPTCSSPEKQKIMCTIARDGRIVQHFSECRLKQYVCENNASSRLVDCPRPATNNCPTCSTPEKQEIICTKDSDGRTVKHYSRCNMKKFVCENNSSPEECSCY